MDRAAIREIPVRDHPFRRRPHHTVFALSLPVLVSLIAEPLTGLADTFFISGLGDTPLAALGVAVTLLSSVFWAFNFLGIGTQTEVAQALGSSQREQAREVSGVALALGAGLGTALAAIAWPFLDLAAEWMGTTGAMTADAVSYLRIRLLGGPATLMMIAGFGALRGLQDMRTPLRIAVVSNGLNILLDPLLIFGAGPVPQLGVAGAAWASTASQWLAAALVLASIQRRLGLTRRFQVRRALALLVVGRDLVLRTALLLIFLLIGTRVATQAGAAAGAAHQVIRQVWLITALLLDAYAHTAQSLIGYFLGAGERAIARKVAAVGSLWAFVTGLGLSVTLWLLEGSIASGMVPPTARGWFSSAWGVLCLAQPLSALSFVTDGIHWGTRDYRYLRNAMLLATGLGILVLARLDPSAPGVLRTVWLTTVGWLAIRTLFGMLRVWPGTDRAPLGRGRDLH